MIGGLVRLLMVALSALAIGTLVTEAALVGVAWSRGWLDPSRVERYVAVFQGRAKILYPEEERKPDTQQTSQAISLVDIARARAMTSRDRELREQSLATEVEEFRLTRSKLSEEMSRYMQMKNAFDKQLDELRAATLSSSAETTRLILETIKPKQAKEQLIRMVDEGSMQEVVALLSGMSAAKRAKVIGEFKTEDESDKLARVLKQIRTAEPELSLIDQAKTDLKGPPTTTP